MASQEMAAMLDELMGRNRNAMPHEKLKELTWEDDDCCKYFIVDFCPHDIFVNTKSDLGPCSNVHDEELKKKYHSAESSGRKTSAEDDFIRFCQKMVNDLGHKIRRSKERLKLTQLEQAAAAGISQQDQANVEEQIAVLTEKINVLVDRAEKSGCEGDVEEAQGVLKLCDQLRVEREDLKKQIGMRPSADPLGQSSKPMEVCEICGSFLIIDDAQSRIDDHLKGKQHMGYSKLKAGLETILETRRQRREDKEKERESKDKVGGEEGEVEDGDTRSSKERTSKDRDSKPRTSRDKRSRSKSRDRRRRSRSRDRGHRDERRGERGHRDDRRDHRGGRDDRRDDRHRRY